MQDVSHKLTSLELVRGKEFVTTNGITVFHPKLSELEDCSSKEVYGFMNIFCLNPEDIYVELWKYGIDFEEITQYDLFLLLYINNIEMYNKMFRKLTSAYFVGYAENDDERFLIAYDASKNIIGLIDKQAYEEIKWFFEKITFYKHKDKQVYSSQGTKKKILDMEAEDLDSKEDQEDDFGELVSAVVWGNTSGYNFDNIWNLYFYQFNAGIRHLDKIKYTSALMNGVYSGNVDVKRIDKKELDWKTIT